ncbi:uncharacterized protein LOC144113535 isoform X3 [Amblyomma americanum]
MQTMNNSESMEKVASFLSLCLENDLPAVRSSLTNRAAVDAQDAEGTTGLQIAATNGYKILAEYLIGQSADVNLANNYGWTPLMHAAQHGQVSVVALLLHHGATVNATGRLGASPLMLAASGGHLRAAQVLMHHRANPNQNNFYGQTALDVATACAKMEVAEYLRSIAQVAQQEHNPNVTDIFDAIVACDLNEVRRILEEHPPCCNWCHSKKGTTPLMQAAILGYIDAVALLVESNADLEMQDCSAGWTALMHAVYHGQLHVARYLISSGADVYTEAFNGATALDIACYLENGNTKIIQMLADETVAGLSSQLAAETERKTNDSQHLKVLKEWIGSVTQKLTTWRGRQPLLTSIGWAASLPSSLAVDLQSMSTSTTHETVPALDISFTSPETIFPEVDSVFWAAPPSLTNYKKMLEGVQAALPDSAIGTHSQKLTRRAIEPKFHHLKQPPLTESESSGGVMSILQALGLGKYARSFEENEVDWEAFVNLDPGSIEAIGVLTGISREVLQEAIYELQKMRPAC